MARSVPEHLKVPWGIAEAIGIFLAIWLGLYLVITIILGGLSPLSPLINDVWQGYVRGDVAINFAISLVVDVLGLGIIAWRLRHYGVSWKTVGWRRAPIGKSILYLIIGLVGAVAVASVVIFLVGLLVPAFDANQAQTNEFTDAVDTHRNYTLLALVVLPPIIEETIFRGFIFPAFAKRWGVVAGAIASSALFGLAHLQANITIYTFFLGLVLCFLYVRLKSIFPGMAVHMLNNLLAYWAITAK